MNPSELRFTKDHEWIGREGDLWVVGISEHAQNALGDVTYVELPEVGRQVSAHEETAVVESVKAASDVYAPVAGTIAEVNHALEDMPEWVNKDAYGKGWFFKLSGVDEGELAGLMDHAAYEEFAANEAH